MPKRTTAEEEHTRSEMSRAYNAQKHDPDGWDDWGMFTAHVVHGLIAEVGRLRHMLRCHGIDPGPERDPFEP